MCFLALCHPFIGMADAATPRTCNTAEQAIEVAGDILPYVYPDFRTQAQEWKPVIELEDLKTQQYWVVTFLPAGNTILGGGPKIALSRPSCHVLEIREIS